ncbi:hypothetical protein PF008_g14307 [Phytophthora fragariae]|uniref:Uncharacterized protein n=1 Tax=Phytophthora fragariae TaxID=53985 RepID=A0A6G0RHU8_9STRA|nr:hypothetical protein PF008_g14307 [Phytophthora fragariae]
MSNSATRIAPGVRCRPPVRAGLHALGWVSVFTARTGALARPLVTLDFFRCGDGGVALDDESSLDSLPACTIRTLAFLSKLPTPRLPLERLSCAAFTC